MTRILKTSGFLVLVTMMSVGFYQGYHFAIGQSPPFRQINGHARLGVLSILAIVTGFAVDAVAIEGRTRRIVVGLFIVGQWLPPITWWVGFGTGRPELFGTIFL